MQDFHSDHEKTRAPRKPGRQWSREEDLKLCKAVENYGTEDWNFIAQVVGGGRTRQQCHQRWFRGLDPTISRERWSPEEEKLLLKYIKEEGLKAWTKIAKKIGTRNDVQCRYHYKQILKRTNQALPHDDEFNSQPSPQDSPISSTPNQTSPTFLPFTPSGAAQEQNPQQNTNSIEDKISAIFDSMTFIEDPEWKSSSFFGLF